MIEEETLSELTPVAMAPGKSSRSSWRPLRSSIRAPALAELPEITTSCFCCMSQVIVAILGSCCCCCCSICSTYRQFCSCCWYLYIYRSSLRYLLLLLPLQQYSQQYSWFCPRSVLLQLLLLLSLYIIRMYSTLPSRLPQEGSDAVEGPSFRDCFSISSQEQQHPYSQVCVCVSSNK